MLNERIFEKKMTPLASSQLEGFLGFFLISNFENPSGSNRSEQLPFHNSLNCNRGIDRGSSRIKNHA
jgi:hypothetical protein